MQMDVQHWALTTHTTLHMGPLVRTYKMVPWQTAAATAATAATAAELAAPVAAVVPRVLGRGLQSRRWLSMAGGEEQEKEESLVLGSGH